MLCKEVMTRDIECLSPRDTAQTAARKMRDANVGFLPICDQLKKVIGTVTDRDISIRMVAENRPANTSVSDLMTRDIVSCRPDDDLRRAEQLMGQHHKSRVLCLDDGGRLAGVISLSDIAQHEEYAQLGETMRKVTFREARTHLAT